MIKGKGIARADPDFRDVTIDGMDWPEESPGDPDNCKAAALIGCDECDNLITCCRVWYKRGEFDEGTVTPSLVELFEREEGDE